MRTLSSVTLSACSPLCLALLLTACGGKTDGASNAAGSAGTDATGGSAGTATAGSGGSGNAGTSGSGGASTAGAAGTSGNSGSGGAAGTAGTGGSGNTVPVVIGAPGEQCSPNGQLACGGLDSRVQLICSGGVWDTLSLCPGTSICDSRADSTDLGTCVEKNPLCPSPNYLYCEGNDVMECDQVQLGASVKESCMACDAGQCVGDVCPSPLPTEFMDTTGDCLADCSTGNTSSACSVSTWACEYDIQYGSGVGVPQGLTYRVDLGDPASCPQAVHQIFLTQRLPVDANLVFPLLARLPSGSLTTFVDGTRCAVVPGQSYVTGYDWLVELTSSASQAVPTNIEFDWTPGAHCP